MPAWHVHCNIKHMVGLAPIMPTDKFSPISPSRSQTAISLTGSSSVCSHIYSLNMSETSISGPLTSCTFLHDKNLITSHFTHLPLCWLLIMMLFSESWQNCWQIHSMGKWAHVSTHVTMQQNCSGFYQYAVLFPTNSQFALIKPISLP